MVHEASKIHEKLTLEVYHIQYAALQTGSSTIYTYHKINIK